MTRYAARRLGCVVLAGLVGATGHAQSPRSATLKGRVSVDTSMRPIAGVEVSIPTLNRSTLTDDNGGFLLADVPAGIHRVRARKIGYAMYDMSIKFEEGETVQRPIVLPRLTILDTIVTVGDPNVPLSFLDHRAVGLGVFLTRTDLEKLTGRHLSSGLPAWRSSTDGSGRGGCSPGDTRHRSVP